MRVAAALGAAACGAAEQGPRLRATVIRPPKDTVRFEVRAAAYRCAQPGAVVLQGAGGANGVLVWLRFGDSLRAGDYPLRSRGDSTPRSAAAGVRFAIGDYAHGAPLDSGAVSVTPGPHGLGVRVRGSGLEAGGVQRIRVDASLDALLLEGDTVTCRVGL